MELFVSFFPVGKQEKPGRSIMLKKNQYREDSSECIINGGDIAPSDKSRRTMNEKLKELAKAIKDNRASKADKPKG